MKAFEDFRWVRYFNRLNGILQMALVCLLIIGLHLLSLRFYSRKDFSTKRYYSLSAETLAYLKRVDKPLNIFVVLSTYSQNKNVKQFFNNVQYLLKAYQKSFDEENKALRISYVDPFRDRKELEMLMERYKLTEENAVIVVQENRFKVLPMNEFYTTDVPAKFQGESALTLAILNLTQSKPKSIYWITGHGEIDFQNVHPQNGASLALQSLVQNNMQVKALPYAINIPEDADLIIACGPQTSFLPKETRELKHYLQQRNGRFIAFLPPVYEHGLDALLHDWGISADDRLVVDNGKDVLSSDGDLLIRRLKAHPITNLLIQNNLGLVFGFIRPVRPDLTTSLSKQKQCTPLLYASDTSWAKKDYASKDLSFDANYDLRGPFPIAMLAERKISTDIGIQIPGGCLLVFGCSDWITNSKLRLLGNRWLFLNAVKWALEQEESLHIPPKALEEYTLNASQQKFLLLVLNFLILPLSLFFMGTIVFFIRKE